MDELFDSEEPLQLQQNTNNALVVQNNINETAIVSNQSLSTPTVPTVQNVVATVDLGCRLELRRIAMEIRNTEYNPKRFAAVIMRIRQPKTTALIFGSGKLVVTGAKNEEDAELATRKYAKIIQKLKFKVHFRDFKIQNMVGRADVGFPVRIEGVALKQTMFCSYEPELFPGLVYRMKEPRVVLLIFVTGKVVITGAKCRADINEAFSNIYPVLELFRKPDAASYAAITHNMQQEQGGGEQAYGEHGGGEYGPRIEFDEGHAERAADDALREMEQDELAHGV